MKDERERLSNIVDRRLEKIHELSKAERIAHRKTKNAEKLFFKAMAKLKEYDDSHHIEE